MESFFRIVLLFFMVALVGCQKAPRPGYTELPNVVTKRKALEKQILELLPEKNRQAAANEAIWLADTAFKASAAIARYNAPKYVNWLNNRAVNSKNYTRHRGLCWHYQHDLYRELRRRPLKFYKLGCCVRDKGRGAEHHVVYIMAAKGKWPSIIMLDAWWSSGRLRIEDESDAWDWTDDPETTAKLNKVYRAGHKLPMEHWYMIRQSDTDFNAYIESNLPAARKTYQWKYMQSQMKQGLRKRKGKAFAY